MHADAQEIIKCAVRRDVEGIKRIVRKHYGSKAKLIAIELTQDGDGLVLGIETSLGNRTAVCIPIEWEGAEAA